MKEKYKAILLVLSSEDVENTRYVIKRLTPEWKPLYPFFKKIYEQYMYENPEILVLFVYGADTTFEKKNYDLTYESVFENDYPGMVTKTLYAMRDITEKYDYDFLIRTNLSTFWDLKKLGQRLDKLPKTNCLTGTQIKNQDPQDGQKYHYIAGFDMVLSRDIVEKILPHSEEIIQQRGFLQMEDLSICTGIKNHAGLEVLDYPFRNDACWLGMDPFNPEKYQAQLDYSNKANIDHYRVKTRTNRNIDKDIHTLLLRDIYGKTIL